MEHFYSTNWALLLRFMTEEPIYYPGHNIWTFHKHQQANALALFLSHSDLATPELNRTNVSAMLQGEMSWPHSGEASLFSGNQISLPFLEEGGFISFPGGWLAVHCRSPQKTEHLDPSIKDILQSTDYLKEISLGRNGYIKPHFIIEKDALLHHLSLHVGKISLKSLFPGAVSQEEYIVIPPDEHQFGKLESTYLWQHLLRILPQEKAFERWLLCTRVQSNSLVPVEFSLLEDNEIAPFLKQVTLLIESAPELFYSIKTLHKQAVNSYDFVNVVEPQKLTVNQSINSDSETDQSSLTIEPVLQTTIETLDQAYHFPIIDDPADIDALEKFPQRGYVYEPLGDIVWLIKECVEYVIHIDNQTLSVHPFANNLLSMAVSRPALGYLLFSVLPQRFNRKYILFLLAKSETSNVAFYHLTHRESSQSWLNSSPSELKQAYLDMLMIEYIRASKGRPNNGEYLLKIALYLADNIGFYTKSKNDNFQYRSLECFMRKLDDEGVVDLGAAFVQISSKELDARKYHLKERSIYFIGLWLIERIESIETVETNLSSTLGNFVFQFYQCAFKEGLEKSRRDLKSDAFFTSLPWQGLLKTTGVKEFLSLSKHRNKWHSFLTYDCEHGFDAVSVVRQYLQLLMIIVKYPMADSERSRVWQRIISIVCTFGFGTQEKNHYIFINALRNEGTNLWKAFSLFLNMAPSELYEEFSECCIELMPLDSLYILLDRCNIHDRKLAVQNEILQRQGREDEGLGLASLETAFIHACNNGHMELAAGVLSAAKPILERFAGYSNHQFKEIIYS